VDESSNELIKGYANKCVYETCLEDKNRNNWWV